MSYKFDSRTCLWLLLVLHFTFSHPISAHSEEFFGRVVGVTDGDTIRVTRNGKSEKIRLAGIDCPEKDQKYGLEAKRLARKLVYGRMVLVIYNGRGRYGRIIGKVILQSGEKLSLELVQAGGLKNMQRTERI